MVYQTTTTYHDHHPDFDILQTAATTHQHLLHLLDVCTRRPSHRRGGRCCLQVRALIENRSKVVLSPASTAYKHSLKEVLASPLIAKQIANTKAAREVQALQVRRVLCDSRRCVDSQLSVEPRVTGKAAT